ncbi:hypothetical protein C5167_012185 [Papaver somniferum]|uniref:Aminotransferase-like plant mobile domain-containing protein n=1 Tax=Papaver somniferum TaxID=3469 RepID=A0A4Y7J0Q8_PAPSO|nr:hypothetical protein C5167_012185 [Papaver somniferum]
MASVRRMKIIPAALPGIQFSMNTTPGTITGIRSRMKTTPEHNFRMNTTSNLPKCTGILDNYFSMPELCPVISKAKESKAKEANRGKAKAVVTKKKRKDGLDTPHSLPPRGNNKKRLGVETRGDIWESGRDCTVEEEDEEEEQDEQDEEESEEEDNEINPSQVVMEQVGSSQQPTQGKGTSKVKVKASFDPGHLFGYKDSWARTIYQTYVHKKVVRCCRNQASSHWDLSKECEEVQTLVKDSGLYTLVENYVKPDIVTVNCFVERYHGEIDTMHFPFDEMTLIPDDAQNILGLSVTGKSIAEDHCPELEWSKLHALTNKLLGWDYKTPVESFYVSKNSRTKTIKLTLLKKTFEGTTQRKDKDGLDPAQIRYYTTDAYLLFILGTRVFPDTSGNRVSVNYLQYLDPLEEVCSYSWGTVVMEHLMTEMRRTSKAVTNQFVGNFTLLQVWAYENFPTLFKGNSFLNIIPIDDLEEPRAKRYQFNTHPKPGNNRRLIAMRLALDAMTTKDVVCDPYREARENHQYLRYYNVAFYNGPLFPPKGYVMADPRRVIRQLGYKKLPCFMTSSHERYVLDLTVSMSSSTRLRPIPPTLIITWNSHPFVVRPDDVEVPPQKNPPVPTPTEAPPTMAKLHKTVGLLRRRIGKLKKMLGCKYDEGEGLSNEEVKEVVEKLDKIEEPDARALFGETRKAPVAKKQKTKVAGMRTSRLYSAGTASGV